MRVAICFGMIVGLAAIASAGTQSPARAQYLRCEYLENPLGIGERLPRLSWEMHDDRRGAAQTAYHVLVASSPDKLAADGGDLWDSGRVASHQSAQVVYQGKPLGSRMRCYWKVRLWDAQGLPTPWSPPAMWTMGLLHPEDVRAKWIGLSGPMIYPGKGEPLTLQGCVWIWFPESQGDPRHSAPAGSRFFRGILSLPAGGRIARARLLLVADDRFTLVVNGIPAGQGSGHSNPQVAEITHHLHPGKNVMAVTATNATPGPAGLAGKLLVEFEDGSALEKIVDASWWRAGDRSEANWTHAAFDDSAWKPAQVLAKMGEPPWGAVAVKPQDVLGCPLLRKEFQAKAVRRATLYASALGDYQISINGRPVCRDYFTPGWSDYRKRVYLNTYDVTALVRPGANAIGAVLAAGWYAGAIGWKSERFHYGTEPRLLMQLELENEDGSTETVVSDASWKAAWGPYIEGEFLAGETYDARKEIPGWDCPGLDDSAWKPVAVTERISALVEPARGVPVRQTGVLKPVAITEPKPGVFVFDMGQNFAGFARLKVQGPAGTKVVLRFAERLNPDGTIYTTNLRTARATDTYILKGQGEEVWQPRFTFHGFQYVEVSGYPGKPGPDAITGIAIHSATPLVGAFECSSPMVNRLYQNIVWTQRANFISIPTDCPQRDERLGWTGDAEAFIRAATYNADVAAFFTKWLVDLEDAQRDGAVTDVAPDVLGLGAGTPAWADAGTICPWTVYWVYNDRRVLENHYDMMARLVEYYRKNSKELLRPAYGYGDWLSVGEETPKDVIATAFFAYSTHLTAEAARALGRLNEAQKYDQLFREIKRAFNRAYVAADGRIRGNTQTCYAMALYFDLLPEDQRPAAARYLVENIQAHGNHLTTGFIGTSMLMPVLAQTGNQAIAYRLLLNDTYPSWGYSIKHGATSIWERWDGWTAERGFQDPGMNSFAHYSFGAVARWMFQSVAGIDTDGPGFQRLLLRPLPEAGLEWVKASYRSLHGRIASEWRREPSGRIFRFTLPANTSATLYLPTSNPQAVRESGQAADKAPGVKLLRVEPGAVVYELGAGRYEFATP